MTLLLLMPEWTKEMEIWDFFLNYLMAKYSWQWNSKTRRVEELWKLKIEIQAALGISDDWRVEVGVLLQEE